MNTYLRMVQKATLIYLFIYLLEKTQMEKVDVCLPLDKK